MKNFILLFTAIFFAGCITSFALEEQDSTKNKSEEKVTILTDQDLLDFELDKFIFHTPYTSDWESSAERPMIKLFYGTSTLADKNYDVVPFKDNIDFDLRLGYYKTKEHKKSILTKTDANDFFISNISDEFVDPDKNFQGISNDAWRFGFNDLEGYGYKFHENLQLNFYHSSGLSWTYMNFDPKTYPETDSTNFDFKTFNESVRFGEQFESGVSIQLFEKVSLNAAYERINVYPRHMFWYWSLSKLIEASGQGLVDQFVKEIRKFSPAFTPVFHFLLKGGLSYGIYELRKKKMNWPINTAPPFTYENIKFGVSFNF